MQLNDGTQRNDGKMALRQKGHSNEKDQAKREKVVEDCLKQIWSSVLSNKTIGPTDMDAVKLWIRQLTVQARYGGQDIHALCGACAYEVMRKGKKAVNMNQIIIAVHSAEGQKRELCYVRKSVAIQYKKLKQWTAENYSEKQQQTPQQTADERADESKEANQYHIQLVHKYDPNHSSPC